MDLIGNGTVVSIDIDRTNYSVEHPRIVTITGDSSGPDALARVTELCHDKTVLVVHDGDHSKEAVRRELEIYARFVTKGSYFIVEDGIVDLYEPRC